LSNEANSYQNINYQVSEGIARLTLDRPEAMNSLDLPTCRELSDVAIRIDEDPTARCVLISGTGKAFCAGGDVAAFASAGDGAPALLKKMTGFMHSAWSRLLRGNAPVVTAVNGVAAGAGLALAALSDLVVAARSARFTMAYTGIGLTPDGSSTYFLSRLVGLRRAQELVLTNRVLSADEALDWGLVTRVVDDEELAQEADKLAAKLAAGPTLAYGRSRALLLSGLQESLETQMELEARAIADSGRTADFRAGLDAFVNKKRPTFTGN
jgi:2-(1,2-epoxy-1,2-dihydrophenyl)acetyl-CoA isomerase